MGSVIRDKYIIIVLPIHTGENITTINDQMMSHIVKTKLPITHPVITNIGKTNGKAIRN